MAGLRKDADEAMFAVKDVGHCLGHGLGAAGPHEGIHIRKLLGKFTGVALRQASGHHYFTHMPLLLALDGAQDCIY
jgi:F0F1-type ATP synthase membrane subunit c/vacuolar-type H+-ATPase subunit K